MTINIAVVTSEALVLGCDSIASATEYLVDPFACEYESKDGVLHAKITPSDIVQRVTNTWDGVTKMFQLHGGSLPVAAVTAGLAKLNNRSMSSYANEFHAMHTAPLPAGIMPGGVGVVSGGVYTFAEPKEPAATSVQEVANSFLQFMRSHYEAHYADSKLPEEYRDGPVFLIGGYSPHEHLPSLYRVNVQKNTVKPDYQAGKFGVAWEGQSDAVERLLRGYDSLLRMRVEIEMHSALEENRKQYGEATARIVQEVLDKLSQKLPDGLSMDLPASPAVKLPWDAFGIPIGYGDLPLQDAINLTAYLVGLQSGKARFAYGVPTVGGRTHVGVITKVDGFKMLEEPQLRLTNTGFA